MKKTFLIEDKKFWRKKRLIEIITENMWLKWKELIELLIFFNEIYKDFAWWAMGWMIWVFIWLRGFWFDLDVLDNNYILDWMSVESTP